MSTLKTYRVKGMHCASCASIIERTVKKIDGVEEISVNSGTENAKISFDEDKTNPDHFNEKLNPLGYTLVVTDAHSNHESHHNMSASDMGMSEDEHKAHLGINQSKAEKLQEINDMKKGVFGALPAVIFSIFVMGWDIFSKYNLVPQMGNTSYEFIHHLLPILATFVFITIGKPYLLGVYRFFRYGKANMDTLIGLGKIGRAHV